MPLRHKAGDAYNNATRTWGQYPVVVERMRTCTRVGRLLPCLSNSHPRLNVTQKSDLLRLQNFLSVKFKDRQNRL